MPDPAQEIIKIVIIGNTRVGKTALSYRLTKDRFVEETSQTIGVNFDTFHRTYSNNEPVKFGVWDTAGEERFRTIVRAYYKDASVAILCFDLTNKQSLADLKSFIAGLKPEAPNVRILLVGTKLDRTDKPQITNDEINEWIKNNGREESIDWFLCSAKTGDGCEELKDAITKPFIQALNADPQHSQEEIRPEQVQPEGSSKRMSNPWNADTMIKRIISRIDSYKANRTYGRWSLNPRRFLFNDSVTNRKSRCAEDLKNALIVANGNNQNSIEPIIFLENISKARIHNSDAMVNLTNGKLSALGELEKILRSLSRDISKHLPIFDDSNAQDGFPSELKNIPAWLTYIHSNFLDYYNKRSKRSGKIATTLFNQHLSEAKAHIVKKLWQHIVKLNTADQELYYSNLLTLIETARNQHNRLLRHEHKYFEANGKLADMLNTFEYAVLNEYAKMRSNKIRPAARNTQQNRELNTVLGSH